MPVSLTLSRAFAPARCSTTSTRSAPGGELDRVAEQVPDDLLKAVAVAGHERRVRIEAGVEADVLGLRAGLGGLDDASHDLDQRHLLRVEPDLAGHDPVEVEQVFDQPHLRARVAVDHFDGALQLGRLQDIGLELQDLGPAQDRAERRPQLVRQRGEKLVLDARRPLRLHAGAALGLEDLLALLAGDLERLDALLPGQVAGELGEPEQPPLRVAQGGDGDGGPEAGAVLADAPAFVEESADLGGDLKLVVRPAALARVGGIEGREVAADDLVRGIALDPLRSGVPRGDDAVGVEHEDRVVGDAFDEQAEALLALAQRLFVVAPLGQVARDLGESDQRPRPVAQRRDDDVGPEQRAVLADPPALVLERLRSPRRPRARAPAGRPFKVSGG